MSVDEAMRKLADCAVTVCEHFDKFPEADSQAWGASMLRSRVVDYQQAAKDEDGALMTGLAIDAGIDL